MGFERQIGPHPNNSFQYPLINYLVIFKEIIQKQQNMNVISAPTQLLTMAQLAFIKEEFTTKHRIFSVTNVKRALTKSQTMLNICLNNTILFININSQIQYWLNGSSIYLED